MIIDTEAGTIQGQVDDGVARFLGVPYAAAPYGDRRFALPRPHPGWSGTRRTTDYGPTAPQLPYGGELDALLPSHPIAGDEVLNLNVWAPAASEQQGHPVMVWIHGGGLTRGQNSLQTYDGAAFARHGVVLVSVNYRLGAEGFSVLDDAPANLGLADQVAALEWVSRNIRAFGGDPDRVTLFGQSAGGACVAALAASPRTRGLFRSAIIQSGPLEAQNSRTARRTTRAIARELGISPTRDAFASVSPGRLVEALARATARGPAFGSAGLGIVVDDDLVPRSPLAALTSADAPAFPLLLGYTSEEYRLWFMPTGMVGKVKDFHVLAARLRLGVNRGAVRLYRRNRPGARPGEILGMLATDGLLRVPKNNLADARPGSTWMYEFAWPSPVADLAAAHAVELPFVFDTLTCSEAAALAGPHRPQSLADAMHGAWVRFAHTGDPGWAPWDPTRPVMTFDHPHSTLVHAPRDAERLALAHAVR